jgi:hypothetical protein
VELITNTLLAIDHRNKFNNSHLINYLCVSAEIVRGMMNTGAGCKPGMSWKVNQNYKGSKQFRWHPGFLIHGTQQIHFTALQFFCCHILDWC